MGCGWAEKCCMQTLETEITYQGRTLRQLKRSGLIAIYDVRNAGELLYGYEVIKIKIAPEREVFGKMYPERELYPSSAKDSPDWGTTAWSFGRNYKKEAMAMFNGLAKKEVKDVPQSRPEHSTKPRGRVLTPDPQKAAGKHSRRARGRATL
jgi:hypothetical protein